MALPIDLCLVPILQHTFATNVSDAEGQKIPGGLHSRCAKGTASATRWTEPLSGSDSAEGSGLLNAQGLYNGNI